MYNLRYHVASLVAVFLALTVGLVLGGVVAERSSVTGRVESLVEQLKTRFDALQQENTDLKRSLEAEQAFGRAAARALTRGALDGRRVLIVTNAGRADGLDAARAAVEQSGGEVAVLMFEKPRAGLDAAVPPDLGSGIAPGPEAYQAIARALAAELTTTAARPTLDALDKSGALSARRMEDPVDACVVLASAEEGPDEFGIALGAALKALGVPCVGAESTSRDTGVAAAAAQAGLSAVDDIDEPAGTCSLVWCLSGRAEGWFGSKKGAKEPFPEF
ncbi:copper transporter [Coriobacteriia bacterium Es71-Z0120]|uniref:copper transporter n=1 Tax=Parvivirga hydrogeniphila TaxID=2939460 RepID=UPI002260FFF7|nr:copper transporter [Parvivirga hydrogeniphila]MCL4079130.1 copper transporter [Parvivirga hydrogeniphila]